jgi:regulator of sigma E protease
MKSYDDLTKDKKEGQGFEFTIIRNGNEMKVNVTVKRIVNSNFVDESGKAQPLDYIGLGFQSLSTSVNGNFVDAIKYCVPYTFKLAFMVLATIGGLFTGSVPITSMTGPVGTVGFMAEMGMYDARNFLVLLPLIAANLAVFNLLPIPALDGSKVIFTLIEWIRKKPLNRKVESIIHLIGILLLFGFVIVIDLVGIFT